MGFEYIISYVCVPCKDKLPEKNFITSDPLMFRNPISKGEGIELAGITLIVGNVVHQPYPYYDLLIIEEPILRKSDLEAKIRKIEKVFKDTKKAQEKRLKEEAEEAYKKGQTLGEKMMDDVEK